MTQTIGMTIGCLVCAWVALEGLLFSVRAVQRRLRWEQNYVRERDEFCRRVEATARAARAEKAIADWEGWRPFRVAAIVDEARDVKSFYFEPVDGRPLSPFAPGQYLTFRLPLPGGGTPLVRCYSLSDRPREDFYRCTIKRVAAPEARPELPGGRGSSFFHNHVRVGDAIDVRAPGGTFLLDATASDPIVLIGSGIGITPLASMLDAILHINPKREVYALLGFRNGRDHPFRERLNKLVKEHASLHLHVSYSAPDVSDVLYHDYNHRGRMTIERVQEILPSNNYKFYVCGPGPMMETLVPALWAWGVPESHVHFEAFGPASVRSASHKQTASEPCEVRFERSDRTVMWDGTIGSLLEFGEAAGIAMPSGCRAGSCGECLTAIKSGSVLPIKPAGVPVPPGHCLTCVSVPARPLVLDA
jgi:ferredoxin-NADP reductase